MAVLLPDSAAAAFATFERKRDGLVESESSLDDMGSLKNDEPALRPDETIGIRHEKLLLPFFPKLRGRGPWTVRWQGAGLRITLRNTTGAPFNEGEVVLERYVFSTSPDPYEFRIELEDGALSIPGLEAGPTGSLSSLKAIAHASSRSSCGRMKSE